MAMNQCAQCGEDAKAGRGYGGTSGSVMSSRLKERCNDGVGDQATDEALWGQQRIDLVSFESGVPCERLSLHRDSAWIWNDEQLGQAGCEGSRHGIRTSLQSLLRKLTALVMELSPTERYCCLQATDEEGDRLSRLSRAGELHRTRTSFRGSCGRYGATLTPGCRTGLHPAG
jgi:hypothetical protein